MIDIIIPIYNNLKGLYNTLESIGHYHDKTLVKVSIVDDCSTTVSIAEYCKCIKSFPHLNTQFFHLDINQGPGVARQYAIERTTEPYIVFIDGGDVFNSQLMILGYLQAITNYNNLQVFVPAYLYEVRHNEFSIFAGHAQLHGFMVSRNFMQRHNLFIPTAASKAHEDIPFCNLCELYATQENGYYKNNDHIWTIHTLDDNSLTQKDDSRFYYQNCTTGILQNAMQLINANPTDPAMTKFIYEMMIAAYLILLDVKHFFPEYYQRGFNACRQFYHKYYLPVSKQDAKMFMDRYFQMVEDSIQLRTNTNVYYAYDIYGFFQTL